MKTVLIRWWLRIILGITLGCISLYFGGLWINYTEFAQFWWTCSILSFMAMVISFERFRNYINGAFAWYPPTTKPTGIIQQYTGIDFKLKPLFEGDTIKHPKLNINKK